MGGPPILSEGERERSLLPEYGWGKWPPLRGEGPRK